MGLALSAKLAVQQVVARSDIVRDHRVRPRSEAEIKSLASQCRRLGGIDNETYFNIIQYLRRCFRSPNDARKRLRFAIVPEWHPKELPYVEYNPLVLVTSQRLLNRAEVGDSFPRFQFAHEIGHIIMHDHHAKAFSNDKNLQISFEPQIYSAEWQANTFAKYFLLPDWVFYVLKSDEEIIEKARIPRPLLDERLDEIVCLSEARGVRFTWGAMTGTLAL